MKNTLFQVEEIKPKKIKPKEKDWVREVLDSFGLKGGYNLSYKNGDIKINCGNHYIISKTNGLKSKYTLYSSIPPLHKTPIKTITL